MSFFTHRASCESPRAKVSPISFNAAATSILSARVRVSSSTHEDKAVIDMKTCLRPTLTPEFCFCATVDAADDICLAMISACCSESRCLHLPTLRQKARTSKSNDMQETMLSDMLQTRLPNILQKTAGKTSPQRQLNSYNVRPGSTHIQA